MNANQEYNDARVKFIKDVENGVFPATSAYFYYLQKKKKDVLGPEEFVDLLQKGFSQRVNLISLEIEEAEMDQDAVIKILEKYFQITSVFDANGEFIKFA